MNLDLATLQVLILALPGFVWTRFTASLSGQEKAGVGEEIISALIFGVISYIFLYLIFELAGQPFDMSSLGTPEWKFSRTIDEVLFAIPVALCMATILLFLKGRQFPLKFLRSIKATNYSGDLDIWDYSFSEMKPNGSYINLRDVENGWIIQGYTRGYSERKDLRELILEHVQVFDEKGDLLFENSATYLARQPDKISIEFYEDHGVANGKKADRIWTKIVTRWKACLSSKE